MKKLHSVIHLSRAELTVNIFLAGVSRNIGNDRKRRKRHEKRSETIGNEMKEDFFLISVCVKRLETTGNDMRVK